MMFIEHVARVTKLDFPFVTYLLHFVKCVRNRITNHPLSLHFDIPPILTQDLAEMLPSGDFLKPKSKGEQLKDVIALQVLMHRKLHEALFFSRSSSGWSPIKRSM
jgi:hypothetical protein